MRKYAAATALAIALNITMLDAERASAAGAGCCGGVLKGACAFRCSIGLWNAAKLWDHTSFIHSKPLRDACTTKCVAAKLAAQH
jgi:hypothetical protein